MVKINWNKTSGYVRKATESGLRTQVLSPFTGEYYVITMNVFILMAAWYSSDIVIARRGAYSVYGFVP